MRRDHLDAILSQLRIQRIAVISAIADQVFRLAFVAPRLAERLGKPVVVENRPGGGSTIGTAVGAKAPPDGHTLGIPGSGSMAISPAMYKSLPYDPVKDIVPIALIARVPFVLIVNPSLPVRSVPELVKYAKDKSIHYGSGGVGSPHHLYAEVFKGMTGIEMAHVPYKGSADAIKDVVAGHIQILFSDPTPSVPLIRSGTVWPLGVTTRVRWAVAPDIPTLDEAGVPGFDVAGQGAGRAASPLARRGKQGSHSDLCELATLRQSRSRRTLHTGGGRARLHRRQAA
jgi:tripartite-type tricarboxylate transporter receptor subunit TctC